MIRKNEIVLYLATMYCPTMCAGLNIGLFRFSLSFNPCFPSFLHHYCLQILYTTNFLIENVFIYLSKFDRLIKSIQLQTKSNENKNILYENVGAIYNAIMVFM